MTSPLSSAQKVLNQRLLSERCVNETQLAQLYDTIVRQQGFDAEDITSVHDALASSNQQLKYLGLEIIAVHMPDGTRHYAMTNMPNDVPAVTTTLHALWGGTAEHGLVWAVLGHLVENTTASLHTLVNLRESVEPPTDSTGFKPPSLSAAEALVERLLEEKWLVKDGSSSELRLGPRTFCELSYLLTEKLGMAPEDVPQRIRL